MDISVARVFASTRRTELLPEQMVMVAYVENRKDIRMHTGRVEKVWKYPTHYEARVAFMPKNEVCFETLYLTDFNNWESPNAWSIVKSPTPTPTPPPANKWWTLFGMIVLILAILVGVWV